MCAAVLKDREGDAHGIGPSLLIGIGEHLTHVIGVAQRDIAFARPDRLDLTAVIAFGAAREIVLDPLKPAGRCLGTVMGEISGGQRDIVIRGEGAGADPALPFRIGQILVACDLIRAHALFRGIDDPRARGQREPVPRRVAIGGRDRRVQGRGWILLVNVLIPKTTHLLSYTSTWYRAIKLKFRSQRRAQKCSGITSSEGG